MKGRKKAANKQHAAASGMFVVNLQVPEQHQDVLADIYEDADIKATDGNASLDLRQQSWDGIKKQVDLLVHKHVPFQCTITAMEFFRSAEAIIHEDVADKRKAALLQFMLDHDPVTDMEKAKAWTDFRPASLQFLLEDKNQPYVLEWTDEPRMCRGITGGLQNHPLFETLFRVQQGLFNRLREENTDWTPTARNVLQLRGVVYVALFVDPSDGQFQTYVGEAQGGMDSKSGKDDPLGTLVPNCRGGIRDRWVGNSSAHLKLAKGGRKLIAPGANADQVQRASAVQLIDLALAACTLTEGGSGVLVFVLEAGIHKVDSKARETHWIKALGTYKTYNTCLSDPTHECKGGCKIPGF